MRVVTVTDAPVARRTVILVAESSRSTYLSRLSSSDWRRIKLFDAPQITKARSDIPLVASIFKVMRETSSLGAVTYSDCVLGPTFFRSPANYLDIAGSVGRSAPTDPDRFFDDPLCCCGFATASDPRLGPIFGQRRSSRPAFGRGVSLGTLHL